MRALVVFGLLVIASRVAHAREPIASCMGPNAAFEISAVVGPAELDINEQDREGFTGFLRLRTCFVERRTRFGTLMGWEANLEIGQLAHDLPDSTDDMTAVDGYHFDLSFGLNATPLYKVAADGNWNQLVLSRQLALRAGFGVNLEYAYPYGGLAAGVLVANKVTFELGYVYVPAGLSHSGRAYEVTEHRPSLNLQIKVGKETSAVLGAELRHGSHVDNAGMAPIEQTTAGRYTIVLFKIGIRLTSNK